MRTIIFNISMGDNSKNYIVTENNNILYNGKNESIALQVLFKKLKNLYKTLGLPEEIYKNFDPESTDFDSYGYHRFVQYLKNIFNFDFSLTVESINTAKRLIKNKFSNSYLQSVIVRT